MQAFDEPMSEYWNLKKPRMNMAERTAVNNNKSQQPGILPQIYH
jgi:hypothetical protein